MDIETLREYCLSFAATSESFPFDEITLVFKVGSKMFALLSLEQPFSMNLKCDPAYAIELREQHSFIVPGFHMNKQHWNTINNLEAVPDNFIKQLIKHSYSLVVKSLTKRERDALNISLEIDSV